MTYIEYIYNLLFSYLIAGHIKAFSSINAAITKLVHQIKYIILKLQTFSFCKLFLLHWRTKNKNKEIEKQWVVQILKIPKKTLHLTQLQTVIRFIPIQSRSLLAVLNANCFEAFVKWKLKLWKTGVNNLMRNSFVRKCHANTKAFCIV